jgi:hypothetical protein
MDTRPLGMSSLSLHLKTILPQNFADRGWSPMVNGQRSKIPAHWECLVPVEGAFVKSDVELQSEAFRAPTPAENPIWSCIKSQCEEGGLMEFEDFWNPPQPPDDGGDNNNTTYLTSSDLPPSGTGGTEWDKNTSIAETTQNKGGQGGTGVQGIGLALEKNKNFVLEKPFPEKPSEEILTSVLQGGQSEYRVDSCNLTQDKVDYEDYPHLTCDALEAKRNQAEDIKKRLLQAQTKEDLTLIRQEHSSRCEWVWKNLLTKAQRQALKEMAAIEQLNLLSQDIKVVSESVLQKSEFEELIEALEFVQTIEEFASITEGSSTETIKDAVLYLESPAQKQQVNRWLETLDFPE